MLPKISEAVLKAVEGSPQGIASLDVITSLGLSDADTVKTTLSRLNKSKRIIRLKRGVYSSNPLKDQFAAAQATFNGYVGFSSALYLHKLTSELPFRITIVTRDSSKTKQAGGFEFKAIALKEKAVGFKTMGPYVVSTCPKTLFDCLYLPRYGIGSQKLLEAYSQGLSEVEWREFDYFCEKFANKGLMKKLKP
ncbi:MAG: hypothetical protein WC408_04890 [Candidatus Micrarchaeia archaeon]|jgi:predicted transcriptional regulator of viral defense system